MIRARSILRKQLLYFVTIALVITALSGCLYYRSSTANLSGSTQKDLRRYAAEARDYIEKAFWGAVNRDVRYLSESPSMAAFLSASKDESVLAKSQLERLCHRVAKENAERYQSIRFIDAEGREQIVVSGSRRIKNYRSIQEAASENEFYRRTFSLFHRLAIEPTGTLLVEGPLQSGSTLLFAYSTEDPEGEAFSGMVLFHCNLAPLYRYLADIQVLGHPVAWVFDSRGNVVLSPKGEPASSVISAETSGEFRESVRLNLGAGDRRIFRVMFRVSPLVYKQHVSDALRQTAILFLPSMATAFVLAFFFSRRISRPVRALADAVAKVGEGRLDIQAEVLSGDEIGDLARSFNRMTGELNSAQNELREAKEGAEARSQEIQRAYRRLEETEDQLIQSRKMDAVGRLAGGIAHDFNNILMVINGQSQLLLEGLKGQEKLMRQAEQIHGAGERAASLTRQLLAFSRKQVLRPKILELNSVVGRLESMLRRFDRRGHRIHDRTE